MQTFNFNPPIYTYNDYKNWKEDWELINGYPIQMLPSAIATHSKVLSRCHGQIFNALNDKDNCSCEIFIELDWKVNETTVLRPDLMIVCEDLKTDFLEFPPTLIVEVLSPATTVRDRTTKFEIYQSQGVKFYLLIDYIKKNVEVFELTNNRYQQTNNSILEIEKDCFVTFDFEKLWK